MLLKVSRHITLLILMLLLKAIALNAQPLLELKSVEPLSSDVNSNAEEGYPLYAPDGKLYFVRSLFEGNVGGRFAGQDIWFIERTSSGWSTPSNDVGKLNNRFNNGVVGIADSGRVLYLNSTYSNKPDYQIGLSKTEWNKGEWSTPQRVSMRGFDPKSSYFTFYVDEKNEVMLLSYSKDGTANEDIFISIKRGGSWGVPIRLGNICSDGAEFAPFLSEDGRTLYFSSNGFPGKGDVDIFMSRRIDNSWTNWSQPTSLPEPINSEKFDAYFTIKGLDAFFSSNRKSEFADLYHAKYEKRVPTKEEEEEMRQEELFAQGMRLDGFVVLPEEGVLRELEVLDAEGNVIQTLQADETGRFELSGLEDYAKYYIDLKGKDLDAADVFIVNRRGDRVYLNKELVSGKFPFETLGKDIQAVLVAEVKDESVFQGTGFELEAEKKVEGVSIGLTDAEGKLIEEAKIDSKGKFEFKKLQTGEYYTLTASQEFEDPILYLRQGGRVIPMSTTLLKGMLFKKVQDGSIVLYQDELLAQPDATKFKFDYKSLNLVGTEVFLYNEKGDALQSAFINEKGLFAFSRLDAESTYKIGMGVEIDPSLGRLTGFNESGDSVALATELLMGEFFEGNPAWAIMLSADQESFRFDYDNLPPAGTVVYLTDENDNVIDSALVDADGNFAFARLRPDMAYKIKLAATDDMSMGLNRFFVIDAEGEKIGFNEEGSSVKNLVGQELATQTEKFTFADENLPPEGSVVYLTDENDIIIDSAVVDENGEFRFMRLKPDGNYKIKLAATDDMSMGLSRFFVIDAEGEKIGFNEQGVTEREVAGKALAASTERFQFDYSNLPPAGTVVYLTDENNNIIDSATVDANGGLRYKRLDDKDTYKLKLAKTEDISEGLGSFALIDAEGDLITFNENGTSSSSLVGKEAAKQTEAFQFDEQNRPEEGSVVYLTDENDNIIDSAVVDENGEFRFARLTPFGAYKIKLQDAQDQSKGLSSFFIYDATGTKIELDETGTTTQRVIGKEEAKVVRFYAFDYGQLPPDGTVIYITDANDKIVDSVVVKNGAFRYKKLNAEGGFGLQMKYPDGTMYFGDAFRLLEGEKEEERKRMLLSNTLKTKDYFDQLSEDELEERFDQFEFDGEPPLVGTKIYIYSDAGLIQDSAIIYSRGRFTVSKLKNQEEYIIKVGDTDYDVRKSELYALIKNERRKLSKLNQAYSYRPIMVADEEDTKFNFDKFIIEASEPIAQGTEVYLFENDAQRFVDTAAVAEDGSFAFKQLDREKQYSLKFDEQFNLANAKVYSVTEDGQKAVEQNENGFEIDPERLLRPQQETITLILGDVEADRDIQLDQKEIKPFPLTPPVNEKEEPILVEKNVVNETVFEPAPVKAKPPVNEVKKAVATLDDSDWRSMMGKGDIYETSKGYNLHFGFNEFLLNPNQIEYLRKVVIPILRANPELTLTIEGHTDNIGSEEVNHRMAVLRASNVLYHLEMNGVEDTRLRIMSKGELHPIAPNDIPEGRAINRRVEIIKNK